MSILTVQEKAQCLKNLLADPDDWISQELLRLNAEEEEKESEAASGVM